MTRLDEIEQRLAAATTQAAISALRPEFEALVKFARAVEAAEKKWRQVSQPYPHTAHDDVRFRSEVLAARRDLEAS